ncbi:class I SAM-dependent methyltransferase [Paenibacillus planticolens]|uniref:SAM-dependent methyltransferase n=1 Tax=Paenibacillus planticolens TaxID=2654976 RepID=A0ABX1ZLQ2_9BACL|nr:class I SAM-dependent methyltransferase [Paenibacillus planticolens]NOV00613.1 SAM-dependent methyltransferase [Paenibacillus planticolens]
MQAAETFQATLVEFSKQFDQLVSHYDHTLTHRTALEQLINTYSAFITNPANQVAWERWEENLEEFPRLVEDLRRKSAIAVAIMEKYRAFRLQQGDSEITDYFMNIESCIEQEFGSSKVTSDSKVLMVGSGSFPMTPLLIAGRTGAEVVGIDIDDEAVSLGSLVVKQLGSQFNIRLEQKFVEELIFTREATHIIFSSTVSNKYELLDQLHALTIEDVVVAMRYGNGLKSLFNYPMQEVDEHKWQLVDTILRPNQVFDVALYRKA